MKLKKKIQNSMILVVLTSLILTYGTMIFVVYYQTMEILKNEIQQEADYIEAAVCISGVSYLEDMDAVRENTRVTLIDASDDGSGCMLYGDICLASCKMADCQINLPDQSFESCRTVGK